MQGKKKVSMVPVELLISGQGHSEHSLYELAEKDSVGHGGTLLAESMVEQVRQAVYDGGRETHTLADWFANFDDLIDIAAGEAIRDIAVRSAVLKQQLTTNETRMDQLKELFDRVGWIRGVSRFGKPASPEAIVFSAIDEVDALRDIINDVRNLFQEWVEEDNIEGQYTEDIELHHLVTK